jgi:xanthine dehydrogenase accessory factor
MALAYFDRALVIVRGGGDLASGAIYRLRRAGFPVVVTELETPLFVRRTVSYGEAVYSGSIRVEGIVARLATNTDEAKRTLADDDVAVIVDPNGAIIPQLNPPVVVDARMEKVNLGTTIQDAPLVVALGPGFLAGADCHAVIETNRGHNLGRVIYDGATEPDTGTPGKLEGHSHNRVLRAPASGHVRPHASIGDTIEIGQLIALVDVQPIVAPFAGVLRGLIHERVEVKSGMKIGDLDPRAQRDNCFTISDKSLAVGGGVLEAVLAASQVRPYLMLANYETPESL